MAKEWPADKVERRRVADLIAYARNARTHTAEQVAAVAASIREWGWTTPVLIDEDNGIIAGHCRVMAAQKLGLDEVPTIVAKGWTEAQKRAYVIADNQLAVSGSGWNDDLLKIEVQGLVDSEFDLDLLGFAPDELTKILGDGLDIAGDDDSTASGVGAGEFVKWGRQKVPLTDAELETWDGLLARYVEIFGVAHGFPRWLAEGKHLA